MSTFAGELRVCCPGIKNLRRTKATKMRVVPVKASLEGSASDAKNVRTVSMTADIRAAWVPKAVKDNACNFSYLR
jgi:hypothetical protein